MQLLGTPSPSKESPTKQTTKPVQLLTSPSNISEWKTQQDYKRQIISLELQNEKYRNQLYQLGQTVNKILDKVKLPQKSYGHTPNLEQQLQLVKKQLSNVNQFIQIYQRELTTLNNKKKRDQVENLHTIEDLLKNKSQQLTILKKQVRELSHRNKGLQYKLLEYSKKNKVKSIDHQALQLKQLINENKSLKGKLQQLQQLQERKQKWLQNNIQNARELQKKVQQQEHKLPKIQSRNRLQSQAISIQRHSSSLPKLESQKKIYTKWLQSASNSKKNLHIQKQLTDLQKINKLVQQKIKNTTKQIKQIQEQILKVKQRVEQQQQDEKQLAKQNGHKQIKDNKIQINQDVNNKTKRKNVATMVNKRVRKQRKDWVGKFDGLRFSDNRFIREECRMFKIMFNSMGYCQFFYYSLKDNKKRFNSKLPFQTSNLISQGKQSTFTVQYPDFIKNMRLKLNVKTHRISCLTLISNLGIEGEFAVDSALHSLTVALKSNQPSKSMPKQSKQQSSQVNYEMDIKANQAITCMFGSYGVKMDQKKNVTHVWLEGMGVQLIQDFVEELI